MAGRHRHEQIRCQRLLEPNRLCNRLLQGIEVGHYVCGTLLVDVIELNGAAARQERARGGLPVHSRSHDRCGLRIGSAKRLGGQHRGCSRAERGDGRPVEHRAQHPVRGVRQQHEPGDRRQALLRVARKGRDPFQGGVTGSERGHRAKVARRIRGHVDLRRHRPLAARVGDERVAHRLERALRRDRGLDVPARKERNGAQTALTAAISFSIAAFASSKSITVFGS